MGFSFIFLAFSILPTSVPAALPTSVFATCGVGVRGGLNSDGVGVGSGDGIGPNHKAVALWPFYAQRALFVLGSQIK